MPAIAAESGAGGGGVGAPPSPSPLLGFGFAGALPPEAGAPPPNMAIAAARLAAICSGVSVGAAFFEGIVFRGFCLDFQV
jgi:hypothetical protein